MSKHHAKFTWGAGPNSVSVAGNFNNWAGDATPLQKLPDGSFGADVPLPWGEKQAYKYVVDGEWKIREDEAKEWDAAGNMNNVYTAPHAPAPGETTGTVPPASSAAATAVPSTTAPDTAPTTKSETTAPSTLLASSAPGAASSGKPSSGQPPVLGAASFATTKPAATNTSTSVATEPHAVGAAAEPVKATAAVPIADAPVKTDSTPVQIEKTAANANIGEAPQGDEQTLQERAAEYGAAALSGLGAALGGAVAAVEKATGVDLTHGNPLTVDEAKAQGIDVNTLAKRDAETDTTAPVGTKPPAAAVADLEEKTQQLRETTNATRVANVPLPNGEAPKSSYANAPEPVDTTSKRDELEHDLPAQHETTDNHKTVPQPIISAVSEKDPRKDRSANAPLNADTAGTKPISTDPAVSAQAAKQDAEANPGRNASTGGVAQGILGNTGAGETVADPTAKSANDVDSPPTPLKDASAPAAATGASFPSAAAAQPVAPSTPAKNGTAPATVATPASGISTAASTPAKPSHKKEETTGADVRKRKSSIFGKIKHAFSPKDKEKK